MLAAVCSHATAVQSGVCDTWYHLGQKWVYSGRCVRLCVSLDPLSPSHSPVPQVAVRPEDWMGTLLHVSSHWVCYHGNRTASGTLRYRWGHAILRWLACAHLVSFTCGTGSNDLLNNKRESVSHFLCGACFFSYPHICHKHTDIGRDKHKHRRDTRA